MNIEIKRIILSKTGSSKIIKSQKIQDLWSGYGSLTRVYLENKTIILKLIKFPSNSSTGHPKGWNTDISHQRKVNSYQVEMNWYQNYNNSHKNIKIPNYIASGAEQDESYLILQDLQEEGYYPVSSVSSHQIKLCISWLAHFHKYYLNVSPSGLWEIGTYWHLETRPEEYKLIQDKELKDKAHLIDKKLNTAKYKTIVHGDAKLANFLFATNLVSAVDFQYVGGGAGIKDLAYFLSSVFNERELTENEEYYLDYYFKIINDKEIENEWRQLYPYAWCDFYRFLQGWSPGHPKINSYSQKMKEKVLACL